MKKSRSPWDSWLFSAGPLFSAEHLSMFGARRAPLEMMHGSSRTRGILAAGPAKLRDAGSMRFGDREALPTQPTLLTALSQLPVPSCTAPVTLGMRSWWSPRWPFLLLGYTHPVLTASCGPAYSQPARAIAFAAACVCLIRAPSTALSSGRCCHV